MKKKQNKTGKINCKGFFFFVTFNCKLNDSQSEKWLKKSLASSSNNMSNLLFNLLIKLY